MMYDYNWNKVIKALDLDRGDVRSVDKKFYLNIDGRFNEVIHKWKSAGYDKIDSVEWINYYPEVHFDKSVVDQFSATVNLKCARCWISRIRPGKMAPYHQDIDDNIEKYLKLGPIERYSVFISPESIGSIFLLKDQAFHFQKQGTVIKWDDYLDWHAGTNCGFVDKFMFHFLGVNSDQ